MVGSKDLEETRMQQKIRWALTAVAVVAVAGFAYQRYARPLEVQVVETRQGATERVLAITGRTRPQVTVTVVPKVSGQILRLTKEEGESVKAGELLVQLDADIAQASLDQADSAVSAQKRAVVEAERNFDRMVQLRERGLTTQQDYDRARFDLDQAQAEQARLLATRRESAARLDDSTIVAPVSGVVLSRPVDRGQVVSAQSTIYELAPLAGVEVEADVDEQFLAEIQPGMRADVLVAGRDAKIPATLYYVSPKVDPRTGGAKVRLRLDSQVEGLRAGVTTDVNLIVEEIDAAVTVARSAILGRDEQARVLVVKGDRVEQRSIRFVDWPSEKVVVEQGLAPGEKLVAQPRPDLIGKKVDAILRTPREAALAHAETRGGARAL